MELQYIKCGREWIDDGNFKLAQNFFELALQKNPNSANALMGIAQCYVSRAKEEKRHAKKLKLLQKALSNATKARDKAPTDNWVQSRYHLVLGASHEENDMQFLALDEYNLAIKLDPSLKLKYFDHLIQLQVFLGFEERNILPGGKRDREFIAHVYRKRGNLYEQLGDIYIGEKKYATARHNYDRAIHFYTKAADVYEPILEGMESDLHILKEKMDELEGEVDKASQASRIDEKIMQVKGREDHEVLKVGKGASSKEIKSAYKKLALKYHPDKITEDLDEDTKRLHYEIFLRVTEAKERMLGED